MHIASGVQRNYGYAGARRFHFRAAGAGRPVLVLHDWFGSSFSLLETMQAIAREARAIAPDLPGFGESEDLPTDHPSLEDYAHAVLANLDALGLDSVAVIAQGASRPLSDCLLTLSPQRFRSLEPPHPSDPTSIPAIDLAPKMSGAHLLEAWSISRDRFLFSPWFEQTAAARLQIPMAPPSTLHHAAVDLLRSGDRYRKLLHAGPARAPQHPSSPRTTTPGIERSYVTVRGHQLLCRRIGPEGGVPLVLFHASPGSSAMLEGLMRRLSRGRPVISFDNPGNGDSELDPAVTEIHGIAAILLDALHLLGVERFDLYGTHTGAAIAIEAAIAAPQRVRSVILDGVALFSPQQIEEYGAHYTRRLVPQPDGAHLLTAWHMFRDMTLWFPWYRRDPEHSIRIFQSLEPAALHRGFMEFLKGALTYHVCYEAALTHPTSTRLPLVQQPLLLSAGAKDVLRSHLASAGELVPHATVVYTSNLEHAVETFRGFLDCREM